MGHSVAIHLGVGQTVQPLTRPCCPSALALLAGGMSVGGDLLSKAVRAGLVSRRGVFLQAFSLSNNSSTAVAHGTVVTGPSRLSQKVCPLRHSPRLLPIGLATLCI